MPKNSLYKGKLEHRRLMPKNHKFIYNIFYFLIDIDHLDELKKKYIFLSYNNFNLFSIHDRDHGFRDKRRIKSWIKNILKKIGIDHMNKKIFLLSMPRIFGYAFNPLSIFFCYDFKSNLKAIIYQVKNTFGEQHSYVFKINKKSKNKNEYCHSCKKKFHVSPFWDMETKYNFRITDPKRKFYSSISMEKKNEKIFEAFLNCKYEDLNIKNLFIYLIKFPFLTIKVVLAIYFEAIKIYLFKGAKYFKKPILKEKITIIKK